MPQISKNDDFVISIPRRLFRNKGIQKMLSEINFSSIECKSKASQKDIDNFLLYVKKKRVKFVKPLINRIKDRV